MKDILIGIAGLAAALATLTTVFAPDLSKRQNKIATAEGVDAPAAYTKAQRQINRARYVFVAAPCVVAFACSAVALFVHSSR